MQWVRFPSLAEMGSGHSVLDIIPSDIFPRTFPLLDNSPSFFPRDATHKRGLYVVMRRLSVSVCPSVTFVDHLKTNKRIFKSFSPSGSQGSLVFPTKRHGTIPTGTPLTGASNARSMKKWRFSTNISLYLRNDARYSHSYYERRIGNRTQTFEWYQF